MAPFSIHQSITLDTRPHRTGPDTRPHGLRARIRVRPRVPASVRGRASSARASVGRLYPLGAEDGDHGCHIVECLAKCQGTGAWLR